MFKQQIDNHGFIFNCLLYFAGFTTIFLFTYLKPHILYKKIISALFNMKFKWRGADWKVYHVLVFVLSLFSLLMVFLKMQLDMYQGDYKTEAYEKRMYRLSQKWLIEAELWLVFLIIIEIATIYKMARMNDKRLKLAEKLEMDDEQLKNFENKETN